MNQIRGSMKHECGKSMYPTPIPIQQVRLLQKISDQLQEIVGLLNIIIEKDKPVVSPECEHL